MAEFSIAQRAGGARFCCRRLTTPPQDNELPQLKPRSIRLRPSNDGWMSS